MERPVCEPPFRTREELRQGSAWLKLVNVEKLQGPLQALNRRRLQILQDLRYRQAPEAIDRVLAFSLSMADFSENVADAIAFAIDLEFDYLFDHYHVRVFTGMPGVLIAHDKDIYQDRLAAYHSLEFLVQEFVLLATFIGGTYCPDTTGKREAAAETVARELGFTTGRPWPNIAVEPETTRINPEHLFELMVDRDGAVIVPSADFSDNSSSSDAHEGL